ncbi:beta-carotene hydroxylase [Emticicia sp.]|uniref:beta-carotene hydroxylase n=1 Tax=Emticicia sp. TaxID=1930953 RepID=UPI0037528B8A
MLLKFLIVLGTFAFMEFMAWFAHKYIMHGFGWGWHADHHNHRKGFFEKNDYYAIVFSIVASSTIIYGNTHADFWYLTWFGAGVTCYGIAYFVFHDIIVHRRVKIKFVAKSKYMKRIMHAHYIHHKVHTKEGAEAFGFLYAPEKYEPKQRE